MFSKRGVKIMRTLGSLLRTQATSHFSVRRQMQVMTRLVINITSRKLHVIVEHNTANIYRYFSNIISGQFAYLYFQKQDFVVRKPE